MGLHKDLFFGRLVILNRCVGVPVRPKKANQFEPAKTQIEYLKIPITHCYPNFKIATKNLAMVKPLRNKSMV